MMQVNNVFIPERLIPSLEVYLNQCAILTVHADLIKMW